MSSIRVRWGAAVAGLAVAVGLVAQEKKEAAPPAREEIATGFRAFVVAEPRFPKEDVRNPAGKRARNPVDLVTEHGLEPVIAVFARTIPADATHPLAPLVQKLDALQAVKEYKADRLGAFLVFLALKDEFRKDETRDARIKEIEQFVAGVMPKRTTIALAEATATEDGNNQPLVPAQVAAMGIGPEDDIVIIFYNNLHVVKRWKFPASKPPTDEDLKAIEAEVAKTLGRK